MPNFAENIANKFLIQTVDLSRFSESVRERVLVMLGDLQDDITRQIYEADVLGVNRTDYQTKRQEALIEQTRRTIKTAYGAIDDVVLTQLTEFAGFQHQAVVDMVNQAVGGDLMSVALTPKDLEVLSSDALIQGAPSADWWAKQSLDMTHRFSTQVRLGVAQGESNDDIVRRIRGTYTGQRRVVEIDGEKRVMRQYNGGVMDVSTRDATSLVRTSVQTISNQVIDQTYKENQDVLKGRQWVSTLDFRTTPICRKLDGGAWDFDGNPLPQSKVQEPFPGPPPIHWQCRSVCIPLTKSWEELIKDAGGEVPDGLEEVSGGTRASMDGQVANTQTYSDWFDGRSASEQRDILGPGRYDLYENGKVSLADMVDQSGRSLTLDELKDKYN